jgi:hypothetical protein
MPFGIANVTCSRIRERRGWCVSTALIGSLWYNWCTPLFWCRALIGPFGTLWRSFPYIRVHLCGTTVLELTLFRRVVLATASLNAFRSPALEFEWNGFNRPVVSSVRGFRSLIA